MPHPFFDTESNSPACSGTYIDHAGLKLLEILLPLRSLVLLETERMPVEPREFGSQSFHLYVGSEARAEVGRLA